MASRGKGCDRCLVTDEKGGTHHAPDCPEMRFPSGQPRWQPGDVRTMTTYRMSKAEELQHIYGARIDVELVE